MITTLPNRLLVQPQLGPPSKFDRRFTPLRLLCAWLTKNHPDMNVSRNLALTALMLAILPSSAQLHHETWQFTNVNRLIPDGNWSGFSETLNVTSTIVRLSELKVTLHIDGEYNGDLYGYLRHVSPTVTNFCVLLNRPGRSLDNLHGYADMGLSISFDDAAAQNFHNYQEVTNFPYGTPLMGSWQPDGRHVDPEDVLDTSPVTESLGSFCGSDATGAWTLFLADVDMGATNALVGCQLEFSGARAPSVIWPTPSDIVYGTRLGAAQLNAECAVPGVFTYHPSAGDLLPAGTHQLSAVFTPSDLTGYTTVTSSVSLLVLPKPLVILASDAVKVYDGLAFVGDNGFTCDGFIENESTNVLQGTLTFGGNSQGAINVGSYQIIPGGVSNPNYLITFSNGVLTVNPAPLTIAALDQNKVYDSTPFAGGAVSYQGFVNGEWIGVLNGSLTFGGSSQGAINAGQYTITVAGLTSPNYGITFMPGTLSIQKSAAGADLTVYPNPVEPGKPASFQVDVRAISPGAGTPTGPLAFLIDGSPTAQINLIDGSATHVLSSLPIGFHTISVQYEGDQNFQPASATFPNLLVNTQPVTGPDTIVRFGTNDVKVSIQTLLKNDSDADGDALQFLRPSQIGTNGGLVTIMGDWIDYTPPPGSTNSDMYTYTISDGRGTPVTGNVVVLAVPDLLPSPNLKIALQPDGSCLLMFDAIPGLQYRIEYCENINAPLWITLRSVTADSTGVIQLLDTLPPDSPARYYRTVFP